MVKQYEQQVIGTSAAQIVGANRKRTALGISNLHGTAIIYLGNDSGVASTNGFPVYSLTTRDYNKGLGDRADLEVWAISDTATTTLALAYSTTDDIEEDPTLTILKSINVFLAKIAGKLK